MKWFTTLTVALLPAVTLARFVSKRDDVTTTDTYLFDISLAQFIVYRNAQDPATLDWDSDGCTDSPDNPLGFDYQPACYRHDFGYNNYRLQSRFTKAAKAAIDSNFLADLKTQCDAETAILRPACDALAEVYYAAVKAFGGQDATKRDDEDLVAEYESKLAAYNAILEDLKSQGIVE
ncbi:hypothetical protein N0V93_008427 [Gnomoniopsis smithogilvyi]|uniref:Phospholipase A2 n=1 Tax=Gnomoniopsis smithogilvyi TaxID=1191159 RepID=A0A9W8YMZ0_9PEZI|nr:hypothetical protein N0V93_008427 [Gnomoniopsis smithogilvyi]